MFVMYVCLHLLFEFLTVLLLLVRVVFFLRLFAWDILFYDGPICME